MVSKSLFQFKFIISLIILLGAYGQTVAQNPCQFIYVTTSGSGIGTLADPAALDSALTMAIPNSVIKLDTGTYNIDTALYLSDSITLEGGFIAAGNWDKTSLQGATTINRTTVNPEGAVNAKRLVAIYGNTKTGFRLQDLTITTADANLPGMSTYGIHLTSCADYSIVRCQITPGNAATGAGGNVGASGANGNNGFNGQNGNNDDANGGGGGGNGGSGGGGTTPGSGGFCCSLIGNTGNPGATPTGINGGGGAGGGSGAGEARDGAWGGNGGGSLGAPGSPGQESGCSGAVTCGSSESGNNAQGGAIGSDGSTGSVGTSGAHSSGFWVPGGQGSTGTNGTGGAGGGGGGGGAGEGDIFCVDGHGSGGGGGGGGGRAGTGGTGGFGGGSSYAIYLYTNGTNGNIIQCSLSSGSLGVGGAGAIGGDGGDGGLKGNGSTYTGGGEVGCGGNGGAGGAGGNGGNGGDGSNGETDQLYISGTALASSDTMFNLLGQPVIVAEHINCTNTDMAYSTLAADTWDFTVNGMPQSPTGDTVTTQFTAEGRFSISYGVNTYEGFTQILDPDQSNAGTDQILCDVTTGLLSGNNPSSGIGAWTSMGSATVDDSSLYNSGVSNLAVGDNLFVWTISSCCPDAIDTVNLIVNASSVGTDTRTECDSITWIDGITYSANNNTATFNIVGGASNSCDSLATLDLTIITSTTGIDTRTECDSLVWIDGITYTANNTTATFNMVGAAANSCDSLVALDLTIINSVTGTDTQSACDSLTWIDGITYTSSNNTATFNIVGGAANSCDSIVTLDLTITNSATGTDTQLACDSLTWIDGITYTASNNTATFNIVGGAANSCDSIVTLDLTITNSATGTDTQTACGSLTWIDGITYTSSNNSATFNIVGGAANSCDSLVTLDLTIANTVSGTDTRTECDSLVWIDGNTYTSSNNTATFNIVGGAANSCDSIVTLDLTIVYAASGTDTQTQCDSLVWIDGNTYTSNNNTATFNIVGGAANSCDSIVTLDLTINTVDASVTTATPNITANATGATYKWLDCNNSYGIIPGETAQIFTVATDGNYAVEVTQNSCIDTSACVTISLVGIAEQRIINQVSIYPNPSSGVVNIDLGTLKDVSISISNINGQVVYQKENINTVTYQFEFDEAPGVYLVEISSKDSTQQYKLLKK